jgi:hypothetical protein
LAEGCKIALDSGRAADHHMVGARDALPREDFAGESAEAALHAVADDGVADFLGNGETDAFGGITIGAITDEQHESGRRRALSSVRGEKIGPFGKRD